jgi:acyl-CoA 6-desaturase (Delta-6 desaturase)
MSFLNYQIEHHLFPSMPELYMPLVSVEVRAFFAKHGIKYDSRNYFTAMHDTFLNLKNVSHVDI